MSSMNISTKFNYGHGNGRYNLMQAKPRKIFSCKKGKPCHPQTLLGNDVIEMKSQHKHFGMQLESEKNFQSNVKKLLVRQEGV